MRGNPWYALAALWGLVGVCEKQRSAGLAGAEAAASVALLLAVAVLLVALLAMLRHRRAATSPTAR
jgi:hypothetical protein